MAEVPALSITVWKRVAVDPKEIFLIFDIYCVTIRAMRNHNHRKHNVVNFGGGSLLLASLSLITVGFSSYLVVNNTNTSANILNADIDLNQKDIFSYVSRLTFILGQDGIINSGNETIDTVGSISVKIRIDNQVCVDNGYVGEDTDSSASQTYSNVFSGFAYLYDGSNTAGITKYVTDCNLAVNVGTSLGTSKEESQEGESIYGFSFDMDITKEYTEATFVYDFDFGDAGAASYYSKTPSLTFKVGAFKA